MVVMVMDNSRTKAWRTQDIFWCLVVVAGEERERRKKSL